MVVTFGVLFVSAFWFYMAYLRKKGSSTIDDGLFKIPSFFSFNVLIFMATIFGLMFLIRVTALIMGAF